MLVFLGGCRACGRCRRAQTAPLHESCPGAYRSHASSQEDEPLWGDRYQGGCVLFMLAAVHELEGATSRRFCDFRDPPPRRSVFDNGKSYEHQNWWVWGA